MSLLIEHRNRDDDRKELRERFAKVLEAHMATFQDYADDKDKRDQVETEFRDQVKTMYRSLTDSWPTHDECKEMGIE